MTEWAGAPEPTAAEWAGHPEQPEPSLPHALLAQASTYANSPAETEVAKQQHEGILNAFGEGFREGWGPERLGMSDESLDWLRKKGVFSGLKDKPNPFQAFNETLGVAAANGLDGLMRGVNATYRGLQTAGIEAGLHRDIVSILEPFFGSPHPTGTPKSFVRPVEVKPIDGSPNPGIARTAAAKTGDPLIDAILDHPVMKEVIDNPVVDDSHSVPNSWGGSEPPKNPTVYRDKDFPKTLTVDGKTFDTAEPAAVHENVEQFAINAMTKGGMDLATALKVAFWEFGEKAEDAWYAAHGLDPAKVEEALAPSVDKIAARKVEQPPPIEKLRPAYDEVVKDHNGIGTVYIGDLIEKSGLPKAEVHELIRDAARAGDVSINRSSLAVSRLSPEQVAGSLEIEGEAPFHTVTFKKPANPGVPPDLFKGTYPDGDPAKAAPGPIDKPTAAEVAQGRAIIAKHLGLDQEPPRRVTGGVGSLPDLRVARDLGVINERPPIEGTAAEKAKSAIQPITAYHGSPYSFDAFDVGKIGEGEGAQAYGHGLYFAENPGVARGYQENLSGKKAISGGAPEGAVEIKHEDGMWNVYVDGNLENAFGAKSDAESYANRGTLYQVRIHADRDMLLDWDKPLSKQPPAVQEALKKAMGQSKWDEFKNAGASTAIRQGFIRTGDEEVAKALREAGIPGIKYLDQGSRIPARADINAKMYSIEQELKQGDLSPDNQAMKEQRLNALKDEFQKSLEGTRNFVIFDHTDVEITHKNGEPVQPAPPPAPPTPPEPPSGAGGNAAADAWRQRFDQSVGKLTTGEDIKQLIKDAADAQENFPSARRGDVPLQHVEQIADAAGVEPSSIDRRGLGREFKTDAEVRLAYQAMIKLTENVKEAARQHKTEPTEQSRIALQEALMRRDLAVEQVVGFRAEWGRVGNTIQEFMERVKNQEQLGDFLNEQGRGRTPKELDRIANVVDAMDRAGGNVAGILNDARKPGFADKLFWYWQNQLISGWLTHTKYAAANATYLAWNRGVITPLARLMDLRGLGDLGHIPLEALSGIAGSLSATPMAFLTAIKSVKTGLRVPLEGETELARLAAEKGEPAPKFAAKPFTPNQRPISGVVGRVIGVPGDAANALHTFFRIIGYEGEMQAQAYYAAQKEGHNPLTAQFWDRQAQIRANATEDMMQQGIDVANKGTFIQESGPRAKAFQRFTRETPGLRWVFPFTHIPLNLMKATVEISPAAPLSAEVRADLTGANGTAARNTAAARIVAGSTLMGWFTMKALNGESTGDYPNDPKDRDLWKLQGKQPNSILINDRWVSFNKFGPIGDLAGIGATLGQAIPHLKSEDGDEVEKAAWYLSQAAGRIVTDEVGMMSLQMMFEAMKDDKKATTFISSMASSFMPGSSFLGQTASFMDPDMRQAKTIIDGFKYRIPGERETLLPKRDWSGVPVPNPQHGNILRQTQAQADPIDLEMARLGIHPAPPQDRIGGVKLPPGLYDKYHATSAGPTREMLGVLVNADGWSDMPPSVRTEVIHNIISGARKSAASTMQMAYPQIIQHGVEDKVNKITGAKPTKLKEPVPLP